MNQTLPQNVTRYRTRLEEWRTTLDGLEEVPRNDQGMANWTFVQVPHNWEDYHGYHQVSHGNLHGTAWYLTTFEIDEALGEDRLYSYFEGVGSYATVYANGEEVGRHAGGRTTFTVDLTEALKVGTNWLAVKAEHPENIDDLPFVCGGCWGSPNTEGSQPFGMFRPAWLERTGPLRIAPFGVHVLTPLVSEARARVETETLLSNPGKAAQKGELNQIICDSTGKVVARASSMVELEPESENTISLHFPEWSPPQLWSPESPRLHTVHTKVVTGDSVAHTM
ncbi:MAG: sugar-binding domain-containing protein, partial [Puniceicoccales bacterium]